MRGSQAKPWTVSQLIERQTSALETIASRLTAIDAKLERLVTSVERDINPAARPF